MTKTGRPLKYKTPEELEKAIVAFFTERKLSHTPPTISGLALALGFEDRQSIYDYKEREDFSCVIKKAIAMIEDYAEQRCLSGEGSATGAIFWLKNHKWTDKTVQDVNVTGYSLFEEKTEAKAKKYEHNTNKRSQAADKE